MALPCAPYLPFGVRVDVRDSTCQPSGGVRTPEILRVASDVGPTIGCVAKTRAIPNLDDEALNIFTDGSSYSTPRRGGIGFRLVFVDESGDEQVEDHQPPGYRGATNQQMELSACVEALKYVSGRYCTVDLRDYRKIVIYTDSRYVADNFTNALFTWQSNRWTTRDGNPVENAKLWKELIVAAHKTGKRVDMKWHKGHSPSNPHNKEVDRLAKASAKGVLREPLGPERVRRKKSDKATELRSVRPEGQRIRVRIITDKWLSLQRMYRYKLEVTSDDSPYFGNVDNFYSEVMLSAGHEYEVLLNDEPRQPRILENLGELSPGREA